MKMVVSQLTDADLCKLEVRFGGSGVTTIFGDSGVSAAVDGGLSASSVTELEAVDLCPELPPVFGLNSCASLP